MERRKFLKATAGMALGGLAISSPAVAQAKTKLRVGYLHTLAVDGQIWTGMDRGIFEMQGLDLELRQFNTGLEIFQALIGGSLDVLATGAVLSNFPARGQGKVFLVNDIEVATAQLWVRSDQGIKSFADLKGKRIATATGTTAPGLTPIMLSSDTPNTDAIWQIVNTLGALIAPRSILARVE